MSGQRILGIDPGSRSSGYAIIESDRQASRYIESGHIALNNKDLPTRLGALFSELQKIIDLHQPQVLSIEEVFMASNARSALLLGQARGAAIAAAVTKGLPVHEYGAKLVKKTVTGYGNADKKQVAFMACRLLQIPERHQQDETDALAIALCHAFHQPPQSVAKAVR